MSKRLITAWALVVLTILVCLSVPYRSHFHRAPAALFASDSMIRLFNHVPNSEIAKAQHLGRMAHDSRIAFAVPLRLRDQAGLAAFIEAVSNPESPLFGKYLTTAQFTETYSPSADDYDDTLRYFSGLGLNVVQTYGSRTLLDVDGSVADIEKAFDIEMHEYKTADGRTVHAPNADPSVAQRIGARIHGIVGLSNFAVSRRVQPGSLSAPGNGLTVGGLDPSDIRKAYGLSSLSQTGVGRTLGLFEMDGYTASDVATYASSYGIANPPPLQNILLNGASGGATTAGADEVTLDIELMMALAPGATKILVYEGPEPTTYAGFENETLDLYQRIANDNLATEVSSSWGAPEDQLIPPTLNSENTIFMQMASQGQAMFVASGDSGAYDDGSTLSIDDPSAQPYVVSVGGTSMTINSASDWQSETSWSNTSAKQGGGGGISITWPIPTWQVGLATSANLGSATARMVPDVSLNADPNKGYSVFYQGKFQIYGGTSCSAPLWAAFFALVNQQRVALALPTIGFANPLIYRIGPSSIYNQSFHDIGDLSTNLHYPAEPGYDLSTGWGSFKGAELFQALTNSLLPPTAPASATLVGITQ